jgi:hypothetical protein
MNPTFAAGVGLLGVVYVILLYMICHRILTIDELYERLVAICLLLCGVGIPLAFAGLVQMQ